jgi:hypothetical protein
MDYFPNQAQKASEFLIRLALDATDPSASSPIVIENIFHLNSAAGVAEFMQRVQNALLPILDLRPSTF